MFLKKSSGPRTAVLQDGTIISLADLPVSVTRWVASRKALVVAAVEHGLLTRDEAIARYGLSIEEFESWVQSFDRHGMDALKITQLQRFSNHR
ncbi:DUF1153 domain-containing protein [Paracoccus sp. MBLB3053]|uniref:DUF1153 domain-containing protein n=1 Tax=Paracoccus aurantius TaxID=3073814 RepID=A0ABU2HTM3_9RHOB|nr:DUF1153 domain-containing protein [Paracoccus sp. MBLB3053]MDS9468397.1 DUF1153 domain-containing protein [Paracoccus sp. MBLB3053]